MENIDFVLRATKLIVESCTRAKHGFRKIVLGYFEENKELNRVIRELPKKRKARDLKGNGTAKGKSMGRVKRKVESNDLSSDSGSRLDLSSDEEREYDGKNLGNLKKVKDRFEEVLNDEIRDVFGSDDWSLFDSESNTEQTKFSVEDLESMHVKLSKFSPDLYDNLLELKDYLENFKTIKKEDQLICKILLQKIKNIEFNRQEEQFKKLHLMIQSSISAILKGFNYEADWKYLLSSMKEAGKVFDLEEILRILRITYYIFPDTLNENNINDIKPLMKEVKIIYKLWESGQTKNLASEILRKWNHAHCDSGYKKEVTFYNILESINLEDSDHVDGCASSNLNIFRAKNNKKK